MVQHFCGKDGEMCFAFQTTKSASWYTLSGNSTPIVCTALTLRSGQEKRKSSFTFKVSLRFDVKGFIITKYWGNVKWMQWEILGSLFKSQLRFLEGQERLCREMKADTYLQIRRQAWSEKNRIPKVAYIKSQDFMVLQKHHFSHKQAVTSRCSCQNYISCVLV